MKIFKYILASCALAFASVSCSGFLDEYPEFYWSVDEAITTYDNAEDAVNGVYSKIVRYDYLNGQRHFYLTNKSGMVTYSSTYYNFAYTQSTGAGAYEWSYAYSAINAANLAIESMPNVDPGSFPTETAETELLAEARLLRGYLHSIILMNFCQWYEDDDCEYGIIYKDAVTNASNAIQARITVGESWEKIMEDLDYAIEYMPSTFATNRKTSQVFAKALKAKLLLIRGSERGSSEDLSTALTLVNDVLNNLPSAIAIEPDVEQMYDDAWDNTENIFVRYLEDDANRSSYAGYWTCYYPGYYLYNSITTAKEDYTLGLAYGTDWIIWDPRFDYITGEARKPETWDTSTCITWTKFYRQGYYDGKNTDPIDEKYAVYYMRLPEIYLMQAELIARTGGSYASAIAPINTYRAQRTAPVLEAYPTPTSDDELYDIIFKEYVMETIFENDAVFFASTRLYQDGQRYIEKIKGTTFDIDISQYPIPAAEMTSNNLCVQNPRQS